MNFLVDAHLPRKRVTLLNAKGHHAIHTLDLPLRNRTPDDLINEVSLADGRVVITKDSDFVDSHLLQNKPWKLLFVSTGNIRNKELLDMFSANLQRIVEGFEDFSFIEINRSELIFHS